MKIKLELDMKKVERKINKELYDLNMKITEAINGDIIRANVIPFDKGDLQSTSFVKKINEQTSEIWYNQPYAVKLWYGEQYNFQTSHNANATHHWALPYMTKDKLLAYSKAFLKAKGW